MLHVLVLQPKMITILLAEEIMKYLYFYYIVLICYCPYQFQMAQDYFQPVAGGVLVDVSCGSGLFSRKFANSGTYSAVIALDFSENMLRQCYEYIKEDDTPLNT